MDAADAGQGNADPIVGMESLGLECLIRGGFDGSGQGPDLAVGENSVYVEEYEANAAGTLSGRKIHSFILRTCMTRRTIRVQLSFSHCILPSTQASAMMGTL
jgi:hypothetical protein